MTPENIANSHENHLNSLTPGDERSHAKQRARQARNAVKGKNSASKATTVNFSRDSLEVEHKSSSLPAGGGGMISHVKNKSTKIDAELPYQPHAHRNKVVPEENSDSQSVIDQGRISVQSSDAKEARGIVMQ